MTKKKSIFTKLFIALVALTLISCCFLGSTFARYTSGDEGSASVEVAKWDVDLTAANGNWDTMVKFNQLSPKMTSYAQSKQTNTNAIDEVNYSGDTDGAPKLFATITNNSDVKVTLTVTIGETKYWTPDTPDTEVTFAEEGNKYAWSSSLTGTGATKEQVQEVLAIEFYYGTSQTWSEEFASNVLTADVAKDITLEVGSTTAQNIYIFARASWTTAYADSESEGVLEDAIDTWIGENVNNISATISVLAVQASELPTA